MSNIVKIVKQPSGKTFAATREEVKAAGCCTAAAIELEKARSGLAEVLRQGPTHPSFRQVVGELANISHEISVAFFAMREPS